MSGPRILLAGGGTAGHVEPALATADALVHLEPDCVVTLLGTERGLETRLVPERGHDLALIPPVPLPRRPGVDLLRVPGRLRAAVAAAGDVMDRLSTDVVVGFGGYVAAPAYLAARRRRLPVVVHEANARPGLANRLGARFATAVAVADAAVPLKGATVTGIPLRPAISQLDRETTRAEARAFFGLDADAPTLLVFGGSQGARRLNETVSAAAGGLLASGTKVLHVTGRSASVTSVGAGHVVRDYVDRMDLAYAAADVALCRAGALTCAELTAVGLPAAYVPLPVGNGEQRLNALPVVSAGGGVLVDDSDCTPAWVADTLTPLLHDRGRVARMAAAASAHGHRDADVQLARLVLSVVRREVTP